MVVNNALSVVGCIVLADLLVHVPSRDQDLITTYVIDNPAGLAEDPALELLLDDGGGDSPLIFGHHALYAANLSDSGSLRQL